MKMKKWIPLEDIPSHVHLHDLHDSVESLRIQVIKEDKVLLVEFEHYLAYRNTDELCTLEKIELNPLWGTNWPFFLSSESDYINEIVMGSYGIVESDDLTHYVITCGNNIIEVLSSQEPRVSWLKVE